jgi:hypothetical protein
MTDLYRPGDFYRICDVCGFKVRASETKKRWDGMIVCLPDWEPRHPQESVRGKTDKQAVRDARPEAPDVFTTTPVTQDDL